jgi:hypothetical protein
MIADRHNKYKETSKKVITNRLSAEREKYEISLGKYLMNKKQEQELKNEKALKKYEGYVSKIFTLNIFITIVFFNEREKNETK